MVVSTRSSTIVSSSKSFKRNREDRHKDKHIDHHKRSNGEKNSGHYCICGYSTCKNVMGKFRETNHVFDRAPIRFRIPAKPCEEWTEFFGSLIRNLHVTEEMVIRLGDLQPGKGRFDVCAHHFTEEVVQQYFGNEGRRKIWAVRLDRADAVKVLHLPLDGRDKDGNGRYWINANNPMVDAAVIARSFDSGSHERLLSRSHDVDGSDSSAESPPLLVSEVEDEEKKKLQDRIDQLEEQLVKLRRDNRSLQRTANRRKVKVHSVLDEIEELRKKREELYTLEDVTEMLVRFGGVNRINLFNKDFHAKYPGAAKCLWGANTYDELITLVECAFPDVKIDNAPTIHPPSKKPSKKRKSPTPLPDADYFTTPLERCLVCRLFFRLNLSEEFIALLFGKHRTTIGNILKEWAPRWGKFGEQISILDITEDYLTKEEPQRSTIVGVQKTINVDGTDTKIETSRKDATSKAIAFGAKNDDFCARSLNWATPTCLTFEHTPQFLARASEKAINEEWGSQGKKKAPLQEWKGVAGSLTSKQKILKMKTATDDLFDYHEMEEAINELTLKSLKFDTSLQFGGVDDGVLLTATLAEVDEMPGMKNPPSLPAQESRLPPTLTGKKQITVEDIDKWCIEREAMKQVQKKSDKAAPVIEAENLRRLNQQALTGGVNSSGAEKLVQLEVHERLHVAYEEKKMTKTILSYYLLEMKSDRHKILKWLGSDLVPGHVPMPSEEDLPDIWLRLAKIPASWDVLGDKGFYKSDRCYPNLNKVRTPWKLSDKNVKQYRRSAGMIVEDRETSDTRVVVEDDYERYRNEKILKGPIQYWQLALLPYAHEWGHAMMNLSEPMRRPGEKSSIANLDYWDKHNKH